MKSKNTFKNLKDVDIWNAENIFHLKSNTSRISKIIYQYEIYKKILNTPGDFLELGVFKGVSFTRFLTFRSLLENNFSRKFHGFDMFGKFPKTNTKKFDKKFISKFEKKAGFGIKKNELQNILFEKKFENFNLIDGDINKTLKNFLKINLSIKIALLHLDLDTYNTTKLAINILFNKISKNGIILIDDYNVTEGVTKAVDEFLLKHKNLKIQKESFYQQPSYIIKK